MSDFLLPTLAQACQIIKTVFENIVSLRGLQLQCSNVRSRLKVTSDILASTRINPFIQRNQRWNQVFAGPKEDSTYPGEGLSVQHVSVNIEQRFFQSWPESCNSKISLRQLILRSWVLTRVPFCISWRCLGLLQLQSIQFNWLGWVSTARQISTVAVSIQRISS